MAPAVTNISTYCFTPLDGLKELGAAEIDQLLGRLRRIRGLEGLTPKVSLSDDPAVPADAGADQARDHCLRVESVRPADYTSPKIAPGN
jgi:hypothetical protein